MSLINFAFCHPKPVPDNLASTPAVCTPKVRLNRMGFKFIRFRRGESVITTEFARV